MAPASAANLGPGFDTLAVALALYVRVDVSPADALSLRVTGEGADLPVGPDHLAARVARLVLGHDRIAIAVDSEIPVGRGLGSSAAVAAAVAAACGASDPLAIAAELDGHAENAAASVHGGLVAATAVDGRPVAVPLPLDASLRFVVLVPATPLPTPTAREALPTDVPLADAAFNVGRVALLLAGLADSTRLQPAATDDRLHQPARVPLFPAAPRLLEGLVAAGARAACWSGAGPSLLAICDLEGAEGVQEAGARLLQAAGVEGRSLLLEADRGGLVVRDPPSQA